MTYGLHFLRSRLVFSHVFFLHSSKGWIALERRLQFPALSKIESQAEGSELTGQIVIPGGGFAKRLFFVW